MKKFAIAFSLLLPPLCFSLCASADELPTRKSGLWEIQTSAGGAQMAGQTIKQCTDKSTDAKMIQMGNSMSGGMGITCTKREIKKDGSNYVADSDCTISGSRMISHTVFSGDFTSNYSGETTTKYEPAFMGKTDSKVSMSAKYVGPCETGQVPGDIVMPGGMKMNLNAMGMMGSQNSVAPQH